jgi:hypothetical protein
LVSTFTVLDSSVEVQFTNGDENDRIGAVTCGFGKTHGVVPYKTLAEPFGSLGSVSRVVEGVVDGVVDGVLDGVVEGVGKTRTHTPAFPLRVHRYLPFGEIDPTLEHVPPATWACATPPTGKTVATRAAALKLNSKTAFLDIIKSTPFNPPFSPLHNPPKPDLHVITTESVFITLAVLSSV